MIKYFSADFILPVSSLPVRNGVVAVEDDGTVVEVYQEGDMALKDVSVEKFKGVIVPGFVNAHCHLELSHMMNKIPQKTGLPKFLTTVMTQRFASLSEMDQAMEKADQTMFDNGIVAVGDHANTDNSTTIKRNSKIHYHTFVEIIGVDPKEADFKLEEAKQTAQEFVPGDVSITPHAPYSCSKELFKKLKKFVNELNTFSIHNQESDEENKLFRYKTGAFLDFFKTIGKSEDLFKAQARNSIQTYLPLLPPANKLILVHNTFTSLKDFDFVERMGRKVIWCLCAKANLYIEGTLPKVMNFVNNNLKIVIGTDSLASNDTLSVLEELKTLHQHFPELSLTTTLQWATLNGAQALGVDQNFGSIEKGKKPGLVLLKDIDNLNLTPETTVKRII